MTTGRINQVANPSSARGEGSPRGTPEEHCRATRATARRPTRGAEPGGLGRGRSGAWASAGDVAVAVVLGREAPKHTPLAHGVASLLGRGDAVSRGDSTFRHSLDSTSDQFPGTGRSTHGASSSLLKESVR